MIRQVDPAEAKLLLDEEAGIRLLDVREPEEWDAARIEGAVLLSSENAAEILDDWPREVAVLVYCHHGVRSQIVAGRLVQAGFTNVMNLVGGIDAWSTTVDPLVPRYGVVSGRVVPL